MTPSPSSLCAPSAVLPWAPGPLVALLREGSVLACPTESVYGLIADAHSDLSCARVVAAKAGRAGKAGMPLLVADRRMAEAVACIPVWAEQLIAAFWPGPLTLILASRRRLAAGVAAADGTIGLRATGHPLLAQLVRLVGGPLTATSANVSGQPATTSAAAVRLAAWQHVFVVSQRDAASAAAPSHEVVEGPAPSPSTIVRGDPEGRIELVREGAIARAAIETVIAAKVC